MVVRLGGCWLLADAEKVRWKLFDILNDTSIRVEVLLINGCSSRIIMQSLWCQRAKRVT